MKPPARPFGITILVGFFMGRAVGPGFCSLSGSTIGVGFGFSAGLNTGTLNAGENYMQVFVRRNDLDEDGVINEEDCDDTDSSSTIKANDADCDGVLTVDDCDDTDPNSINDMDCDGVLTVDDCDDANSDSTSIAEDADCDSALTTDDCNDNDVEVNPTQEEICDGKDSNCDGFLPEDEEDVDNDGWAACEPAVCGLSRSAGLSVCAPTMRRPSSASGRRPSRNAIRDESLRVTK